MDINQDQFELLRKIKKKPRITQRQLSYELGFSLGKLNYCLRELRHKGIIRIQNLEETAKKNNTYILTPKGISIKDKLTINFMNKKIKEYDELKKEIYESERE